MLGLKYKATVPIVSMPLGKRKKKKVFFIIIIIVIFVLGHTHTESCLLRIYPCLFIALSCQYVLPIRISTDIFAYHNDI